MGWWMVSMGSGVGCGVSHDGWSGCASKGVGWIVAPMIPNNAGLDISIHSHCQAHAPREIDGPLHRLIPTSHIPKSIDWTRR